LWQFTRRDLKARFSGSMFGWYWLWLTPLITLSLFTLVFHGIFGMKWPGASTQDAFTFALFLFAGLSSYQFFAEVINKSPSLVTSQPNLVTKVIFPLWILPTSSFFGSVVQYSVSLMLLIIVAGFYLGISWTWLWLPVILLPFLLGVWGASLIFAAIGTYVRDMTQLLGMATTAIMFLSPIFYPLSAVPESWRNWLWLNPLTLVIEPLRNALLLAEHPDLLLLAALYLLGITSLILGAWTFKQLSKGFADVL